VLIVETLAMVDTAQVIVKKDMSQTINKGSFKKGHTPWNAGLKGFRPSPSTEFKMGETTGEKHPSWKGGEQTFTKDCVYLYAGTNKRVRRPKKVYEDAHGPIPNGWILYHLDGDRYNDDLDNLIAIPRAILVKINSGRMIASYHEIINAINNFNKQ
jgi:hypothetical protein